MTDTRWPRGTTIQLTEDPFTVRIVLSQHPDSGYWTRLVANDGTTGCADSDQLDQNNGLDLWQPVDTIAAALLPDTWWLWAGEHTLHCDHHRRWWYHPDGSPRIANGLDDALAKRLDINLRATHHLTPIHPPTGEPMTDHTDHTDHRDPRGTVYRHDTTYSRRYVVTAQLPDTTRIALINPNGRHLEHTVDLNADDWHQWGNQHHFHNTVPAALLPDTWWTHPDGHTLHLDALRRWWRHPNGNSNVAYPLNDVMAAHHGLDLTNPHTISRLKAIHPPENPMIPSISRTHIDGYTTPEGHPLPGTRWVCKQDKRAEPIISTIVGVVDRPDLDEPIVVLNDIAPWAETLTRFRQLFEPAPTPWPAIEPIAAIQIQDLRDGKTWIDTEPGGSDIPAALAYWNDQPTHRARHITLTAQEPT